MYEEDGGFEYPRGRVERRHAPGGYLTVSSFRPWLRDEFDFRCVYCLKRESWGQATFEFDLDHFVPQSIDHERRLEYPNLVYACRHCNQVKGNCIIPDPFQTLQQAQVRVQDDGEVVGLSPSAIRVIRQLDLNHPRIKRWRRLWIRVTQLARKRDAALYRLLIDPPDDLPDLSKLSPPRNDRPDGLQKSWFARRSMSQPHDES